MEGSLLLLNSFIVPVSVVDTRSDTKKGYKYNDDHAEMALGNPTRVLREQGSPQSECLRVDNRSRPHACEMSATVSDHNNTSTVYVLQGKKWVES